MLQNPNGREQLQLRIVTKSKSVLKSTPPLLSFYSILFYFFYFSLNYFEIYYNVIFILDIIICTFVQYEEHTTIQQIRATPPSTNPNVEYTKQSGTPSSEP